MNLLKNIPVAEPFELKNLMTCRPHQVVSMSLSNHDALGLMIFALDEGESIGREYCDGSKIITVLSGQLTVQTDDAALLLEPGRSVVLEPGWFHSIRADAPSVMLQLIVN